MSGITLAMSIQTLVDYGMTPEHAAAACACKSFTEAAKMIRFNFPGHVLSLSEVKRLMGYVFCDSAEAGWDDICAAMARIQSGPIVPVAGIDPSLQARGKPDLLLSPTVRPGGARRLDRIERAKAQRKHNVP